LGNPVNKKAKNLEKADFRPLSNTVKRLKPRFDRYLYHSS